MASFKGQTRRNIKLGLEKHGVEIVTDTTRDHLTAFHALVRRNCRARRLPALLPGLLPPALGQPRSLPAWRNSFLTRYEGQLALRRDLLSDRRQVLVRLRRVEQ